MKLIYTGILTKDLMADLEYYAQKLHLSKDQLIERSIETYLKQIKRTEYIQSFKRANQDSKQQELATMRLQDFLAQVDQLLLNN